MRELLEGRRFGFAPRAALANIAAGLGVAVLLLDAVSWGGWGVHETNAILVASTWVAAAAAVVAILALATALAERSDVPEEELALARVDVLVVAAAALLYTATAVVRGIDTGASAASPIALLLELAGLVALFAGAILASVLYASREWEEIEEIVPERHRRRRAAGR